MQVTSKPSTLNEALEISISISKFDMTKIMMTLRYPLNGSIISYGYLTLYKNILEKYWYSVDPWSAYSEVYFESGPAINSMLPLKVSVLKETESIASSPLKLSYISMFLHMH